MAKMPVYRSVCVIYVIHFHYMSVYDFITFHYMSGYDLVNFLLRLTATEKQLANLHDIDLDGVWQSRRIVHSIEYLYRQPVTLVLRLHCRLKPLIHQHVLTHTHTSTTHIHGPVQAPGFKIDPSVS